MCIHIKRINKYYFVRIDCLVMLIGTSLNAIEMIIILRDPLI